jgi:hypothetical protein
MFCDRPRTIGGDLVAAAAFFAISVDGLTDITNLLSAAAPAALMFTPKWTLDGHDCVLEADERALQLQQTFRRVEGGKLMVDFGLMALEPGSQAKGFATSTLRNALIAYDELDVTYVSAYANFDIGGYTWAKLAGIPISPDAYRTSLLARLNAAEFAHLPELARANLERVIRTAQDDTLIFYVTPAHGSGPMWAALLHRSGLAPPTPCRSPGALQEI